MGAAALDRTRDLIVAAADRLFYEQGFAHTSFAHIAAAVGISRGNFYYHFKTKDEILDAVIRVRLAGTRDMLAAWEAAGATPAERIKSFVRILIANGARIELYGCPVGTLATELAKLDHRAQPEATRLFALFRDWLATQFRALGRTADADELALQFLAMSQGVAVLAAAFRDPAYVRREVDRLCARVDALAGGDRDDSNPMET